MSRVIFISYAFADKEPANEVYRHLSAAGFRVWMAPHHLTPGRPYAEGIVSAISTSSLVVVLLSANADKSDHVVREVALACDRRVPILPVWLDDRPRQPSFDYYLSGVHYIDAWRMPVPAELHQNIRAGIDRLLASVPAVVPQAGSGPLPPSALGSYNAKITSANPACFVLLVDQSRSMQRRMGGTQVQKKSAVSETINRLLQNMIIIAADGNRIRPYFDVMVLGYGIGSGVESAFDQDVVSVADLDDRYPPQLQTRILHHTTPDGELASSEQTVPIWFEAKASGHTVTAMAFERALPLVADWVARHPHAFPPVIINITDGGFTGDDPAPHVRAMQELATDDGNVLVFNCHISELDHSAIMFPSELPPGADKAMHRLFETSSVLPEAMRRAAASLGYELDNSARGYVFNADMAALMEFFDVGTSPARM